MLWATGQLTADPSEQRVGIRGLETRWVAERLKVTRMVLMVRAFSTWLSPIETV